MAGESPDRSKQHESSQEPTSGSGATVPGPAGAGGDPRLARAGDTSRVDQATAVFSTRGLRGSAGTALEEAATAPAAAEEDVEAPDSGDEAGNGPSGRGTVLRGDGGASDTRRRASLASWVRTADDHGTGTGDAADEAGPEAGTETSEDRSGDAEERAEKRPEAAGAVKDGPSADAVETPAEPEEPGKPEAEGAAEAEPEDASEDEREDASAADAAPEADAGTEEAPETEAGTEGDDDADGDASEPAGTEDASEPDDDADEDAVDQPTAVFKTTRRPAVDQPTTMLKLGDVKPSGRAAGRSADGPSGEPADEPADKAPEKSEKSGESSGAQEKSAGESGGTGAGKPAVDQPTTMLKLGDVKPGRAAGRSADGPSGEPADEPADKAPEKSGESSGAEEKSAGESGGAGAGKPAVDQPTTMLKLSDAKPAGKAAGRSADKPAAKAPVPSDAERTSRFVPLRSPDDVASPMSPAEATTALPQVGPERTAQQPLPPKPPLDLLAELTNTPPPPETPVRTVLRRIKIWTPLVVLLVIIFAVVQAVRPLPAASLALTADDTYTFGGGTLDLPWPGQGQSAIAVDGVGTIGTEGTQSPKPIASVAKIMTAYVTLQEHPLKGNDGGPTITADQQAEDESKNEDESTAAMKKGQKFSERQMLQMLMIPSGNNAARLLARWDSDNKTFVGKMNAAAEKLGMTKTTYTDPSGLEKTTVSTAVDQLKLARAVMQNEVFRSVVGMAKADIPGLDQPIYNNNDLLVKQVGVIGLKTGSSTPAGGNLVWAATKVVDGETQTIYGAVLNQDAHTGRVWDSLQLALDNSQKLIDKVQQSLATATVVKKGEVVGYVDDQLGGRTPVVATKNMKAIGWPGLKTGISIAGNGKPVPHEAKAGTVVGELKVGDGSNRAVTIPVALQKDLAEPGYGAKFTRMG
ncbi:serine hydrolase [Streptomyces sp. NPDC046994]|uniref:serine hydrolase n=1 Tax=Streptomyces sp. NPDC046994 TaxID=3155735 RepID=UPI003451DE5D